jgi:hypothetical protein
MHDLSDFCEDDLDDYLQEPQPNFNLSTERLMDTKSGGHLDKLYGGILGSQQWNFTAPKSVDYDLGEWSKTSAMILSDPPKKKYLLDSPKEEKKVVDAAEEHEKAVMSEKHDMSTAPPRPISFAQPDFFTHEKAMMRTFHGDNEKNQPVYKRYRMAIVGAFVLFLLLTVVLVVLGATGYLSKKEVVVDGAKGPMAMHAGVGETWQTTKHVEEAAVEDDVWSVNIPNAPSLAPVEPVEPVEPSEPVEPVQVPSSFTLSGDGEGTYYSPSVGVGACGALSADTELVAALNVPQFGAFANPTNSPACGACLTITGPKGSVQVKVVDKCPGCKQGDLDLSPAAFNQVADMAAGRVKITWTPC